jgi:hypothetical protein
MGHGLQAKLVRIEDGHRGTVLNAACLRSKCKHVQQIAPCMEGSSNLAQRHLPQKGQRFWPTMIARLLILSSVQEIFYRCNPLATSASKSRLWKTTLPTITHIWKKWLLQKSNGKACKHDPESDLLRFSPSLSTGEFSLLDRRQD